MSKHLKWKYRISWSRNDGGGYFEFEGTATQCRSYLKRRMQLEAKLKREGRFNEDSVWVHEVGQRRPN